MRYRMLTNAEWERLRPEFTRRGWHLPAPEMSQCFIAETEDGELAGAILLQIVLHAEPAFVTPGFEGHVNFLRLHKLIEDGVARAGLFPGYAVVVTDDRQRGLVRLARFEHVQGELWTKQVGKQPSSHAEVSSAQSVQGSSRPN